MRAGGRKLGATATKSRTASAAGQDAAPDGVGAAGVVGDGRRGPVSEVQPYDLSMNQRLSGIAEPYREARHLTLYHFGSIVLENVLGTS
jgi:hypothetical protein